MEPTRISIRFCALDSDLTIASSDGVLFKVHHKNLEVHSDVFASAEGATRPENGDEIVYLSETSDVLDLLFQYMYRQPQPELKDVEFSTFAGLAEAAEKYVVYSALGWCRMKMEESATTHPLQVLDYAVKHGHVDLANESAQQSMLSSVCGVAEAMDILEPSTFKKWILFQERWNKEKLEFFSIMVRYPEDIPLLQKCFAVPNPFRTFRKELEEAGYRNRTSRMITMKFIAEDTNCDSKDVDI
ncbi:hypothetical protein C8F04DRAFT_123968 [Mycena alexandri]|uniref:BTB domain-containing protein n=1 Tax=Mycena alexandri TaxID=1745969 RepID=A0AAD6WYV9_9AGAR|nr:hypothetical protein C8F04DRAFT_123968 [Mycena alexandri]